LRTRLLVPHGYAAARSATPDSAFRPGEPAPGRFVRVERARALARRGRDGAFQKLPKPDLAPSPALVPGPPCEARLGGPRRRGVPVRARARRRPGI
jgi:hypothetical protein